MNAHESISRGPAEELLLDAAAKEPDDLEHGQLPGPAQERAPKADAHGSKADAHGLARFVEECPSPYHTAAAIRRRLDAAGFTMLPENRPWDGAIKPGGSYYTLRNNSSLIAWRVGGELEDYHFQIAVAHGDSPTYKLKAAPELEGPEGYLRLDVESYGGLIDYTWFDRPLSVAGRVLVRTGRCVTSRLLAPDRDLFIIPSVAIHQNHGVNEGFSPNRAQDLCPLVSAGAAGPGAFTAALADELGVAPDQVLAHDLYLVNRVKPSVWGADGEFISSPKLDDLMCAYTALMAFLVAQNPHCVTVYGCFDSEEVGSGTRQGARSSFMADTLARVNAALGNDGAELLRALARSMLVSCDNAHAVHPAHPELADGPNHPRLNGGIVVKEAANQKYCTDAFGRAVFCGILQQAGIPYQLFANRSDLVGGSTLGNLLLEHTSVHAIDVGCAQLAMHSSYETAGAHDVGLAADALAAFYAADVQISGADAALLC